MAYKLTIVRKSNGKSQDQNPDFQTINPLVARAGGIALSKGLSCSLLIGESFYSKLIF